MDNLEQLKLNLKKYPKAVSSFLGDAGSCINIGCADCPFSSYNLPPYPCMKNIRDLATLLNIDVPSNSFLDMSQAEKLRVSIINKLLFNTCKFGQMQLF